MNGCTEDIQKCVFPHPGPGRCQWCSRQKAWLRLACVKRVWCRGAKITSSFRFCTSLWSILDNNYYVSSAEAQATPNITVAKKSSLILTLVLRALVLQEHPQKRSGSRNATTIYRAPSSSAFNIEPTPSPYMSTSLLADVTQEPLPPTNQSTKLHNHKLITKCSKSS